MKNTRWYSMLTNCKSNDLTPWPNYGNTMKEYCKTSEFKKVKTCKLKERGKVLHILSQPWQVWFSRKIYPSQVEKKFLCEKATRKINHSNLSRGQTNIHYCFYENLHKKLLPRNIQRTNFVTWSISNFLYAGSIYSLTLSTYCISLNILILIFYLDPPVI